MPTPHVAVEIDPRNGEASPAVVFGNLQAEGYSIAVPATPRNDYPAGDSQPSQNYNSQPDVLIVQPIFPSDSADNQSSY